jgi:hypothetical protein
MSLCKKSVKPISPRSVKLQEQIEAEYQKEAREAAELAVQEVALESSSEEEEVEAGERVVLTVKQSLKKLEKEDDFKAAKKEVAAVFKKTKKLKKKEEVKKKEVKTELERAKKVIDLHLQAATEELEEINETIDHQLEEMNETIDLLAEKLAHWKRTARKAIKELHRIKSSCSCGRAVNYPWILK